MPAFAGRTPFHLLHPAVFTAVEMDATTEGHGYRAVSCRPTSDDASLTTRMGAEQTHRDTNGLRESPQPGKTSGGPPGIAMMKSAHHGDLDDGSSIRRLNRSRFRRVFPQREVCPEAVVVGEIISKNPAQVILAKDDHMVDAISA